QEGGVAGEGSLHRTKDDREEGEAEADRLEGRGGGSDGLREDSLCTDRTAWLPSEGGLPDTSCRLHGPRQRITLRGLQPRHGGGPRDGGSGGRLQAVGLRLLGAEDNARGWGGRGRDSRGAGAEDSWVARRNGRKNRRPHLASYREAHSGRAV